MNPFEAPGTESEVEPKHGGGKVLRELFFAAAGLVMIKIALDRWGEHAIAAWMPALAGTVLSRFGARGPALEPRRPWTVISVAATVVTCAAMLLASIVGTWGGVFAPLAPVLGIVITITRVGLAERQVRARQSMLARDDDQRAHFAEQERRAEAPRKMPTAPQTGARMACSECGELTNESELAFHDGARLCVQCAPAV